MEFWRSLSGILEVELTSAEPEEALSAVNSSGIEMIHIRRTGDLSYQFCIRRSDYPRLEVLCRKREETLHVLQKVGIYWIGNALPKRPILIIVFLFFLFATLYVPSRVLFVKVEGNHLVPSGKILAAAEASGICFGASRREVRSEQVKNALLATVPELQWVGVNTAGCVATVSVRARTEKIRSPE